MRFAALFSRLKRHSVRSAILCSAIALLVNGCLLHSHIPAGNPETALNGADGNAFFTYQPRADFNDLVPMTGGTDSQYSVFNLRYPSYGNSGQPGNEVNVRYHQSREPGCRDSLIVLPIWGSYRYPSDSIINAMRAYSKGTMDVFDYTGPHRLIEWERLALAGNEDELWALTDTLAERVRTTVIDIRRLVDWIQQQPDLACGHTSMIGFSVSALVGSMVLQHDLRIDSGVLVMGGGNPGEIAAVCPGPAAKMRAEVLPRLDLSAKQFGEGFGRSFARVNPSIYRTSRDPSSLLFIDAKKDRCMPPSSRDSLWQALGEPERQTIHHGHKTAFLAMTPFEFNYLRRHIYHFLEQRSAAD